MYISLAPMEGITGHVFRRVHAECFGALDCYYTPFLPPPRVGNRFGGKAFKEGLIRDFLHEKGIAISDTAHQVVRLQGNASDKFLQIVTPLDLAALLAQMPHCDVVMTTGELATDTLVSLMPSETAKPAIGAYSEAEFAGRRLRLYRLPSSSRAYPLPLAQKAAAYARFFREIGLLA